VIFRFVVRRLRWLGRVPLLPQIFDALLVALTAIAAPRKLRAIQSLEEMMCRDFGVTLGTHRFGGTGFYLNGVELGHMHGNGLLDVFVGRANRNALVSGGKALPHHVFPASGWISFWIRDEADLPRALELLRMSRSKRIS
jgi:hypothetical protein